MKTRAPLLSLLLATAACAVNPATGERELMLVSEAQEIQMGREADPQISASLGLVDDAELQAYVSEIGMQLARASERPDLPWSFKVVDDPVVNAFALPGGFIYMTRGILARFDNEAELAGVLGHEIGHVTARHSASQMTRQQLQTIGLGAAMIFSETAREYGGLAMAGLQLLNLSYSRGDETQSDELGVRYLTRLDYDPEALVGVFGMLAQVSGGEDGRVPEWQLTHPYPENREEHIRSILDTLSAATGERVDRDEYLDHIDGIVYGENPREGFFWDARFLHPDLEFELTFPSGWSTVNQRTVVGAVAPAEDAIVALEIAEGASGAEAAMREFLGQGGVRAAPVRSESSGGAEKVRAEFEAQTEQGVLRGEVAFIEHGGAVYRVMGYSGPQTWNRYADAVASTITSFARLTDREALDVEPLRLSIVTLDSTTSLRTWAQSRTLPIELEELAELNRVEPDEVLNAGTRIKTVVGTPLPQ
ncbi:MAG TPA: M48 family metalloprotease [Longimicrobiales bacterium]|nr:M48 family metalloprotease [Longimicrobiales bacterium]